MTESFILLLASGIGIFLVGANTAFLFDLRLHLTGWFQFKVAAIDLMLIYISLSLAFGNPALWRAVIGLVALVIDVVALSWMWYGINTLKAAGAVGYIPIARLGPTDDERDAKNGIAIKSETD